MTCVLFEYQPTQFLFTEAHIVDFGGLVNMSANPSQKAM